VHDDLVRPYLGDSLAVVLVYLSLRAVIPWRVLPALVAALLFAVAVELGQLFHLIDVVGLRGNRLAGFVLGGYFDVRDLACYALGAACALAVESAPKAV